LDVCQVLGLGRYIDLDLGPGHASEGSSTRRASQPSLSYNIGYEKPHALFFHRAVEYSFSSHPQSPSSLAEMCAQTLYVGDDLNEDYMGAHAAGLQAIWLKRSQAWPTQLSQVDRDKVVAKGSMEEVADFIRESWQPV
jgi:FMN phosphatase YigB (HAD superfamily)